MDAEIDLLTRSIVAPEFVDFAETYTVFQKVWAAVKTVSGTTVIDNTNVEQVVSHDFHIRFIDGISSDIWVKYDGDNYKIVSIENYDEKKEFLRLRCQKRGDASLQVNLA